MPTSAPINELEWVQLKRDIGSEEVQTSEGGWAKLVRKCKENPLVPFGALVTVGFLTMGLHSFRKGEAKASQLMMRGRVVAQGFTVIAMTVGLLLANRQRLN